MARKDDDREPERAAILGRRAQLVACAVVAGVGLPECVSCLSVAATKGGRNASRPRGFRWGTASAGAPGENAGEAAFCLTIAETGGHPARVQAAKQEEARRYV
jgi:hypothetical protein